MKLNELKATEGARSNSKRIGRGLGSGNGKTSGKGQKGQNSRSGGGVAIGFEGGQTPFFKRMPKRGFTNFTRKEYAVVNVGDLNKFDDGAEVDYEALKAAGLLKKQLDGVKVLGNGKLEKKLTVKAAKFSESAKKAIEEAGGEMWQTCTSLFKNKETRNRILFTLAMLLIYRIGAAIPVPGVDATSLGEQIADNSLLAMMNMIGGGALERLSVFAMGIGPYITASIIIQLLSMDVIPALTEMAKSGQTGRQQMDRITRYLAVVLAFMQALSMVYMFDKQYRILENSAMSGYLFTATVMSAGTMFLLWIGDRISMKGIGNGISMIIFAGIVSNMPAQFVQVYNILAGGTTQGELFNGILQFALYCVLYLLIIIFVIIMETATDPVHKQFQYQRRQRYYISAAEDKQCIGHSCHLCPGDHDSTSDHYQFLQYRPV